MEDAAIQEDVAQDEGIETPEEEPEENPESRPGLSRDKMLDDLVRKNRESRDVEGGEEPPVEETSAETEPEMVDLKVDGEIIQRPKAEVDAEGGVAAAQKKIAAETRMAQVAEERRRLEEIQQRQQERDQQLTQREQELTRRQQELQKLADNPASDVTQDDVAIAQEFVDGVYSGDEDQAKDAFSKVVKALRAQNQPQQAIDPERFATEVERKIQYNSSLREGKELFDSEYRHLKEDPRLFRMTDEATARLRAEHPDWEPKEIIKTAAQEVDAWIAKYAPKTEASKDALTEQRERKKRADNVQAASSRKPAEAGYKPKTQEEIFADMRRNRSQ